MSGEWVALLSALFWAMGSVLIAAGSKRLHVVPLNLVRCVVSTSFFWVLLPFYGGLQAVTEIPPLAWVWLAVSVLGLLVVGDTLYFLSMNLAGVSWTMPISSVTPLWVVLMAALFVGEPLTWQLFVGALLVVAGMILVSRTSSQYRDRRPIDSRARQTGLLLALIVSLLWAVGQVALKPGTEGTHSVVVNSVRQPMAALMLLALALFRGRWRQLQGLDLKSWAIIVAASVLGTGFGTLFFIMSIQMVGAGRSSVLTSTAPMMALPFSMLWLEERPNLWTVGGTLMTVAGIALVV